MGNWVGLALVTGNEVRLWKYWLASFDGRLNLVAKLSIVILPQIQASARRTVVVSYNSGSVGDMAQIKWNFSNCPLQVGNDSSGSARIWSRAHLSNLAPRFSAERAKPSVPHLVSGLDDFERHTLYRSDPGAQTRIAAVRTKTAGIQSTEF